MTYQLAEQVSRQYSFAEIEIGQTAQLTHQLTEADVQTFGQLTGDFNRLHWDVAFAQRTSLRKPVVYGMLSAAFLSTLIGMLLPGQGALWTGQTLEFLQPAYVGDTLCVRGRVKQKSPATRLLVLQIDITNQDNHTLITGEATVKLLEIAEERIMAQAEKQTILVTGGSGGIGSAIAQRLACEGHAVIVNYRQSAAAAETVVQQITKAGGRALALPADVTDAQAVERLFMAAEQEFDPIQAVVHCAASPNTLHPFADLSWASVQQHWEVQVKGAFHCAQAALPRMVQRGGGALLLIGSLASEGQPPTQQTDYVLAKAGLAALARCLAVEYGPKQIRVNVIAPGMTQTDMIQHIPEKAKLLTRMQTPLRRLAEPADIADVAAFLLSPAARHITGETIRVSGGAV